MSLQADGYVEQIQKGVPVETVFERNPNAEISILFGYDPESDTCAPLSTHFSYADAERNAEIAKQMRPDIGLQYHARTFTGRQIMQGDMFYPVTEEPVTNDDRLHILYLLELRQN